ncbi:MAG: hypothetical protein H6Q43_212, partial [Deltaproteobacteria bacterium]|nr:hypothetical protein [Deltaproteobacteria bacterium]
MMADFGLSELELGFLLAGGDGKVLFQDREGVFRHEGRFRDVPPLLF